MEKVNEMISVQETKAKKKNKGFSLVELIIVIAIMAILVGVVGTQVLPYMEKARQAKDTQVISAICTAAVTAFAENADTISADATLTYADNAAYALTPATAITSTGAGKIDTSLKGLLGVVSTDNLFDSYLNSVTTDTKATKLESKIGKTATSIVISYTYATGAVTVQLKAGTADVLGSVTSK